MATDRDRMVDPAIFEGLQAKIDEEANLRDVSAGLRSGASND